MSASLNILIVTSWYKTIENPNYGSFVAEQARMLKNKGHQVTVLFPHLKGKFFDTISDRKTNINKAYDEGIQTLSIGIAPVFPTMRSLNYKKINRISIREIKKWIAENGKPDIIHSHSMFVGGIVGSFLSEKLKVPFFYTEHASGLLFDKAQYSKLDIELLQHTYAKANEIFFVSQFAKDSINSKYNLNNKNISVLNNMVDDTFFKTPLLENKFEKFSYLIIGKLIPIKGHKMLLNAWKKLITKLPDSQLTIAGNGELKEELVNLAEELGVNENIQWMPSLGRKEVLKLIDEHQVIVSASKIETFGLTIAEAQSRGRPVVVTDSGGVKDVVTPEVGIVTDQDEDSLSEGLIEVQQNYHLYEPTSIQTSSEKRFSEQVISKKLIDHYLKYQ